MLDMPEIQGKHARTEYFIAANKDSFKTHINSLIDGYCKRFNINISGLTSEAIWQSLNFKKNPRVGEDLKDDVDYTKPKARAWFKDFFSRELKGAKESREENESIARQAGVWQYKLNFEDQFVFPENSREIINKVFDETEEINESNLKALFEQGQDILKISEIPQENLLFSTKKHGLDKDLNEWLNYISSNKLNLGNNVFESVKEWNVAIDSTTGEYYRLKKHNKFEIKTITEEEWTNKEHNDPKLGKQTHNYYQEIIDNNLVAKIFLIKDNSGKIIGMRMLNNHLYLDEGHGRKILLKILDRLGIKNTDLKKPEDEVELLRRTAVEKPGEKPFATKDIEAAFTMTDNESALIDRARNSSPYQKYIPKLPRATIAMMAHLAMGMEYGKGSTSGYLCVNPVGETGSSLQVALIPKMESLDLLKSIIDQSKTASTSLNSFILVDNIKNLISGNNFKKIFDELQKNTGLINEEVAWAGLGLGFPGVLDQYTTTLSQEALKKVAPDAHRHVAGGEIQHSSIDLWKDGFDRIVFSTALTHKQNEVVATSGKIVAIRHRINEQEYRKYWSHSKKIRSMSREQLEEQMKQDHFIRAKNFRLYTAATSFTIAYVNIQNDPNIVDKDGETKKLVDQTKVVFEEIINWQLKDKTQSEATRRHSTGLSLEKFTEHNFGDD